MKKIVGLVLILVIVLSFTSCSSSPEDEILGTWEYEKQYEISGVGNLYNRSVYTFEKEMGEYVGTFSIESSAVSSPASYDFTYKVTDSTIEITSIETGKTQTLDYTFSEDILRIGELEYIKVED